MIAEPALNDYGGTNDEKVLSLLVLVSLIGMGCHHMYSEIQGSGKRELQKREVSPFTSITTQGAFDIESSVKSILLKCVQESIRNPEIHGSLVNHRRGPDRAHRKNSIARHPGNHENRAAAQEFALWPERG